MTQRIIGVTDLQRRFKAVFDEVRDKGVPYVLTRGSRPEAVLVPYEEWERLGALDEKEAVFRFDQLLARMRERNAATPEAEVVADIARARAEAHEPA